MVAFTRAVHEGAGKRVVAITAAQSGKTDSILDIIGTRLDQKPVPILYAGPTKDFLTDQFEPRLMEMLEQAAPLRGKVLGGKRMKKTLKYVNGVRLRLAHAGSSSALKSDPAALAIVDEYDEMLANVKGQGDPLGLIEARGITYAEFLTAIVSTPGKGMVETEIDPVSGLEFWKPGDPDDIESPIWRLWQEGTRYHFAWPCVHCGEYFIPRFKYLKWPERATPSVARRETTICCPKCGGHMRDAEHKEAMNARGVFIAPGQRIENGEVVGDPPESSTISFWTSGLTSPFVSWGDRAERYLTAELSGEPDKIQTAINAQFGELYTHAAGGDLPEWQEIMSRRMPYRAGELPNGVLRLVCGVDVQARSLYYVIRGYGARGTSWLIDAGQLWGYTGDDDVWNALADLVLTPIGGMHIEKVFIDSGFRPNKVDSGDEHKVYEFVRRYSWLCHATKGKDTFGGTPYRTSKIEVTPQGKRASYSLNLVWLNTDFFKSLVHSRLRTPLDQPGALYVHEDVNEDYARQLVSEVRVVAANSKPQWVARSRQNHFLDCFDPETELLTDAGWVRVAEAVRRPHLFATVNLETDLIEYQRATHAVEREHDGEMVEIKGRGIDMLVTPNHRMVTQRRNPVDETPRITLAGDLTVWHTLKKTSGWGGTDPGPISFPAIEIAIPGRRPLRQSALTVEAGDLFELLGWFVSEGHTRQKGLSRAVVITQNPGEKQDRIRALLDRMGLRYRVTGGRQIVVTSRAVFDAVAECTEPGEGRACYRKRVPALVRSGTPALIERFIEAAILGDGWQQDGFRTYATTSRKLADDMQELFLKIGRSANIRVREVPSCRIRGGSSKTAIQFHVSETMTKQASLRRSDNTPLFRRVAYRGFVYCVTVPNGTLIARRNGLPLVVGNCEALAAAAAYTLNVQRIPEGVVRTWDGEAVTEDGEIIDEPDVEAVRPIAPPPPASIRDRFARHRARLR